MSALPPGSRVILGIAAVFAAAPASAQTVLERRVAEAWVPLVNIPGITNVTAIEFDGADDGDVTLALPFTFHFMLEPFDSVAVGTNGAMRFGSTYCCSTSNGSMSSSSTSEFIIAPWWDDLVLPAALGHASHGTFVQGNRRAFVIEMRDFEAYPAGGGPEGQWQVWLWEGSDGQFDVIYDGVLSASEGYDASAGWKGRDFGAYAHFAGCSTYCDEDDYATLVGFRHTTQLAPGPDVVGSIAGFPVGSLPGERVAGTLTLQNLGADSTSTVTSSLVLSTDARFDPTDWVVHTLVEPELLAGAPAVDRPVTFEVPVGIPDGDYNLIFHVDSDDRYAEFAEDNNTVLAPTFFSTTGTPTFVQTERAEPFVPLSQLRGISNVTDLVFEENYNNTRRQAVDDADAEVIFPFAFNYLGWRHDRARAGTSGIVAFGPRADYTSNTRPGSTYQPNGFIAAWWDDLDVQDALTAGSYGVLGSAPNRIVVIEVRGFERSSERTPSPEGTWQVWLHEGPEAKFEVRYDGNLSAGENYSATAGWEGHAGDDMFGAFRTCAEAYPYCDHEVYQGMVDRVFTVQKSTRAELIASVGAFEAGGLPGTAIVGTVVLSNLGAVDAEDVSASLYVSSDAILDGNDVFAGDLTVPLLAAGAVDVPVTATVTVPLGATPGLYHVIVEVDPANRIAELEEQNNIAVSAQQIVTGHDLRATAVSAPNGVPGERVRFQVTVDNGAVPYAGALQLRLVASAEQIYDINDPVIAERTVVLAGDPSESFELEVPLPFLAAGVYFPIIVVDPHNRVLEHDDFNNTLAGVIEFVVGPELSIGSVVTPLRAAPGTAIDVETLVVSSAGAFSGGVDYQLFVSEDLGIDATDTMVGMYSVQFNGESELRDPRSVTLPASVGAAGAYLIARVDPADAYAEADETNNVTTSVSRIVTAPDLTVATVTFAPGRVRHGSPLTVETQIVSAGLLYTGTVDFRVWLSLDPAITGGSRTPSPSDVALVAGVASIVDNVAGAATATVTIPSTLPVADWYVFVEVDSDSRVDESAEANNWGRATGRLLMEGPNLRVVTVSGPSSVFIGTAYPGRVTIENDGTSQSPPFSYGWFALTPGQLMPMGPPLFRSAPLTLLPGERQTFNDAVDVASVAPGTYELVALADVDGAVAERDEEDNLARVAGLVDVLRPGPDLVPTSLTVTGTGATAGGMLAVTRTIENRGTADATQAQYLYYLSVNPTIADDDLALDGRTVTLAQGESDTSIDTVRIPAGVPAGRYFIGLSMDPTDQIPEIRETNNTVLGPRIPVGGPALAVTPTRLPDAMVGGAYDATLTANGGPVPVRWSVVRGALPPGLALDEARGRISGTPTEEVTASVTFRASTQAASADRSLVLRVLVTTTPVSVVAQALPSGVSGQPYCTEGNTVTLEAVGGVAPYVFTAVSGLPVGMTLASDGELCGTPRESGDFSLEVAAEDRHGQRGAAQLTLQIADRLRVDATALPDGSLNVAYTAQLSAIGGAEPYVWSVGAGALPPGLSVADSGAVSGTPTAPGTFAFNAEVTGGGQSSVRPMSITVIGTSGGEDDEGCRCVTPSSSAGSSFLFLLAGLVAFRRRLLTT